MLVLANSGLAQLVSPVVCHADLLGNVFVTEERLSGIIDWGCAIGGEPAYDLALAKILLLITFKDDVTTQARLFDCFLYSYHRAHNTALRLRIHAYALLYASYIAGFAIISDVDHLVVSSCRANLVSLAQALFPE